MTPWPGGPPVTGNDPGASPVTAANQACSAVRDLIHFTQAPDSPEGYGTAADAAAVLGALAELVARLPQALDQTVSYLARQALHGVLTVDGGGDPEQAVTVASRHADDARGLAALLFEQVDATHQLVAAMATRDVTYPGPAGAAS